jgi:hypothetical protein
MDGVTMATSPPLVPKLGALWMRVVELKWELNAPKVNVIKLGIPKLFNVGSQLASHICLKFMTTKGLLIEQETQKALPHIQKQE